MGFSIGVFEEIMNEIKLSVLGVIAGFFGMIVFISVYPAMPFLMVVSFMISVLKYFFYKARRL